MKRAARAAYWIAAPLVCLAIYWYGLKAWFQADDFAWLGLASQVSDWRSWIDATFSPRAQGTIRPLSERAFFWAFYNLFGLDPLPFRIWVFLTQFANLTLLVSIARRLTGSAAAGLLSALFWIVNISLPQVMVWTSVYNEALCGFFILLAFHFLLRYVETAERRYYWFQWLAFLTGFGALELNVVYPALAAAFTLLCARKYFRGTLPLLGASALYALLHKLAAPMPTSGAYVMHIGWSVFGSLWTYWQWTIGPAWLATIIPLPVWLVAAGTAVLSAGLLGFALRGALRREWLGVFLLAWFIIVLAPVLPLRDHLSEYYPFLPSMGLAMLGGAAAAQCWRRGIGARISALLLAAVYVASSFPAVRMSTSWIYGHSRAAKNVVLGLESAHDLHPGKVILLDGVSNTLFWTALLDRPYRIFGVPHVYLTPGSGAALQWQEDWGDPGDFILPPGPVIWGLEHDAVVVYDATGERLRNITRMYTASAPTRLKPETPRRVDAGNPLFAYLLGQGWYPVDGDHRWMGGRGVLRIAGPRKAGEKLWLRAGCTEEQTASGPLTLEIKADGLVLPQARVTRGNESFELSFPLPAQLAGRDAMEVSLAVPRTVRPAGDERELGLVFGVAEVR